MPVMDWLQRSWKRTPGQVRKPFIFLLGFSIVVTGIILLPLPGPGWVIIFFGFAILASEFKFAEKVRDKLINVLKGLIDISKRVGKALKLRFDNWMRT